MSRCTTVHPPSGDLWAVALAVVPSARGSLIIASSISLLSIAIPDALVHWDYFSRLARELHLQ